MNGISTSPMSFCQDTFSVSPPAVVRWVFLNLTDSRQETENLLDYSTSKTDLSLTSSFLHGCFLYLITVLGHNFAFAFGYTYVVCLIDAKNEVCQVDTKIDSNDSLLCE